MKVLRDGDVLRMDHLRQELAEGEFLCLPEVRVTRFLSTFLTGRLYKEYGGVPMLQLGCEFGVFGSYPASESGVGVQLGVPLSKEAITRFNRGHHSLAGEVSLMDDKAALTTPIEASPLDLRTFLYDYGPHSLVDASSALVYFARELQPHLLEQL